MGKRGLELDIGVLLRTFCIEINYSDPIWTVHLNIPYVYITPFPMMNCSTA